MKLCFICFLIVQSDCVVCSMQFVSAVKMCSVSVVSAVRLCSVLCASCKCNETVFYVLDVSAVKL